MSAHHDFTSQEPENLGRSAREVQPTTQIGAYHAELAKKAASRMRRQERQTDCSQSLTQPAANLQMAVPDGHFSRPATPMSATTPHHQAFNFPTPGHVQPGYLTRAQPQVPTDIACQVGTATGFVPEYFTFDKEELCEIANDQFANEADSEHAAALRSIAADEEVINSFSLANHMITATPVNLRPASSGRRGNITTSSSVPLTPMNHAFQTMQPGPPNSNTQQTPLVRRTHLFAPTTPLHISDSNKENGPMTPTMPGLQKRGHSESHSSDDMPMADFKSEETTAPTSHKSVKLHASDLNLAWRCIFDCAILHFRLQLSKMNPYPDDVQLDQWAVKAWCDSLEDLITQAGYHGHTAPTEAKVDLIKTRLHQLRGQVRDKARAAVVCAYGFRPEGDAKSINYNCELHKKLISQSTFTYANPDDHNERGSLFHNKIFWEIICAVWYGDKLQSEAILLPQYFVEHMPLETIAFVATAIEVALSKWKTGILAHLIFDAKIYQPVFIRHLQDLCSWLDYTTTCGTLSMKSLQFDLCTKAWEYAGAMNQDEAEEAHLSFADFEGDE